MPKPESLIGSLAKPWPTIEPVAPASYEAFASPAFWKAYDALPRPVRVLADKNYALLKQNPNHPSLRLKKVGDYWSVRVGLGYRALAVEVDDGLLWFWIGSHSRYDEMIG